MKKNSWENVLEVFILDRVVDFYKMNSEAPWFIYTVKFLAIKFDSITAALKHNNLEERVDVKRLSLPTTTEPYSDFTPQ